mgnify:CR=1 FL=1
MNSNTSNTNINSNNTSNSKVSNKWIDLMGKDIQIQYIKECDDTSTNPRAQMHSTVNCNIKTYIFNRILPELSIDIDITDNDIHNTILIENIKNEKYIIGESDCIPGIELPLRHSRNGEHFYVFTHHKFGYGPKGRCTFKNKNYISNSASNNNSNTNKTDTSTLEVEPESEMIPEIPSNSHLLIEISINSHYTEQQIVEIEHQIWKNEIKTEFNQSINTTSILNKLNTRKNIGNKW